MSMKKALVHRGCPDASLYYEVVHFYELNLLADGNGNNRIIACSFEIPKSCHTYFILCAFVPTKAGGKNYTI